jgi:hypothetical protein
MRACLIAAFCVCFCASVFLCVCLSPGGRRGGGGGQAQAQAPSCKRSEQASQSVDSTATAQRRRVCVLRPAVRQCEDWLGGPAALRGCWRRRQKRAEWCRWMDDWLDIIAMRLRVHGLVYCNAILGTSVKQLAVPFGSAAAQTSTAAPERMPLFCDLSRRYAKTHSHTHTHTHRRNNTHHRNNNGSLGSVPLWRTRSPAWWRWPASQTSWAASTSAWRRGCKRSSQGGRWRWQWRWRWQQQQQQQWRWWWSPLRSGRVHVGMKDMARESWLVGAFSGCKSYWIFFL